MNLEAILREGVARQASDIHLKHGSQPIFRISGTLVRWEDVPPLDRDSMVILTQALLSDYHCKRLQETLQVDADVRTWKEDQSPFELLAGALREWRRSARV